MLEPVFARLCPGLRPSNGKFRQAISTGIQSLFFPLITENFAKMTKAEAEQVAAEVSRGDQS